jgi:hypothetical protein
VIHGFPNGATRRVERPVTSPEESTQGTETSKYLQEEKSNEIPQVAASERGRAQTTPLRGCGVEGPVWGIVPHDMGRGAEAAWNGPPQQVRAL